MVMVTGQNSKVLEDETQKLKDETPKAKETTPPAGEPSPGKTFTQVEMDKAKEDAVHNALMKAGRDWKTLELEKDSLSKQLEEMKSAKSQLDIQLDELASENPDKFNVVKKFRELDEWEKKLNHDKEEHDSKIKQERGAMEVEKQAHQATIRIAQDTQREIDAFDIAEEFQGADAPKLKALAETMGADTKDKIRKIAETLWTPKTPAESESPLKLDSGLTIGGLSEDTIRKNYRENPDDPKVKADYFAWRRKKGI